MGALRGLLSHGLDAQGRPLRFRYVRRGPKYVILMLLAFGAALRGGLRRLHLGAELGDDLGGEGHALNSKLNILLRAHIRRRVARLPYNLRYILLEVVVSTIVHSLILGGGRSMLHLI